MVKGTKFIQLNTEKAFKRRIRKEMFYRFFCRIPVLLLGGITWFHLYSLCQYGRIKKNVPVLLVCTVVFFILFLRFLFSCSKYQKNSLPFTYQRFFVKDGELTVQINDYCKEIPFSDLVYYRWNKKGCCLADKEGHFFNIELDHEAKDLQGESLQGDEGREFLKLKLSAVGIRKKCLLKTPILLGWICISFIGMALVVRSAVPYNGKLSWFLQEMKNTKRTELVHDNLYEDKLSGILEDIEKKVALPEKLCIATSFSLHFSSDGTIISFDTMLKGFDENDNYVDSYLISYDRKKSSEIRIDLHGITNGVYEEEKDFTMLVEGMEAVPVKETAGRWREEEYGILYYGWREFSAYEENVIYLSEEKEILEPSDMLWGGTKLSGYSISVYCPGKEEITPYRYLFLPQEEFDRVKNFTDFRYFIWD
ncbi:hypothetical protein [Parablautia muri]|uniref:Uncharacterized protein n=1 Tax=Parablautia muri TaxID=2320879 RepID=A0A9X5GS49_9FIRM|nr:hypothetical protein [Parablautia muri]NBJ92919.1 hypothetical protein [Parablautia muri]